MPFIVPANHSNSGPAPLVQIASAQAARLGIVDGGVYSLRVIKKIASIERGGTSWLVGINGRVIRSQSNVPLLAGDTVKVGAWLRGNTVFLHILSNADLGGAVWGRAPVSTALSWNSLRSYIIAAARRSGYSVPHTLLEKLHRSVLSQSKSTYNNILPSVGALIERGLIPESVNALWYFRASTEVFGRGHREGRRWQHHATHKANIHQVDESNGNDLGDSSMVETVGTQQRKSDDYSHDQTRHRPNRHANSQSDYHPTELPASEEHQTALSTDASQWDYIDNDANNHSVGRQSSSVGMSMDDSVVNGVQSSQSHDTTPTDADNLHRSSRHNTMHPPHSSVAISDTQRVLHDMKILQNHLLPIAQSNFTGAEGKGMTEHQRTGHWVLLPFTVDSHDYALQTADSMPHSTIDAEHTVSSGELHLHYHPTTHQCIEGIVKCTVQGKTVDICISSLTNREKNIFIKTDSNTISQGLSAHNRGLVDAFKQRNIGIKSIQCVTIPSSRSPVVSSDTSMNTEREKSTHDKPSSVQHFRMFQSGAQERPVDGLNTKA